MIIYTDAGYLACHLYLEVNIFHAEFGVAATKIIDIVS